ncbi:hypothetical protein RND71_028437 [Anisodus tanguticus]|uniref:Uncharacterized protein n=1 Tax=Anisodus tanguticus TaxID=243964 RepID=A0AAE1RIF2_9SOLA|nr:hypothetical protein RND71_028437 [Anisodus tanguticus]
MEILRLDVDYDRIIFASSRPGYPPKPKAVIDAITKLRKKISRELYEDRIRSQRVNRYRNLSRSIQAKST